MNFATSKKTGFFCCDRGKKCFFLHITYNECATISHAVTKGNSVSQHLLKCSNVTDFIFKKVYPRNVACEKRNIAETKTSESNSGWTNEKKKYKRDTWQAQKNKQKPYRICVHITQPFHRNQWSDEERKTAALGQCARFTSSRIMFETRATFSQIYCVSLKRKSHKIGFIVDCNRFSVERGLNTHTHTLLIFKRWAGERERPNKRTLPKFQATAQFINGNHNRNNRITFGKPRKLS